MLPETKKLASNNVVSANKKLVREKAVEDGKLVSPIDLTLDVSKPLQLEALHWFNFEDVPARMRLTNSGDTMVVSGKWGKERPYLNGGPLEGNYVFSQVHFHWGSSEHEGSEHTVRGICYPMEMHVVFYKTVYLTQAAALKQDDGVIILAYLFKLQGRSAPGLHWLASQLNSVVEPHTSSQVPPMALASILVPFNNDYVTYWGSIYSQHCRHPVMWLVPRTALAVSSDDLNLFRCLLNRKKEAMTKNFRTPGPVAGRSIFHINPSKKINSLLLPGAVNPPCKAVMVNYAITPLHMTKARTVLQRGDGQELGAKESLKDKKQKDFTRNRQILCHKGLTKKSTGEVENEKSNLKTTKLPTGDSVRNKLAELKENKPKKEKQPKSRLPVPTVKSRRIMKTGLESHYASYFRPDTAPSNVNKKPRTPVIRPFTQS